MPKVRIEFEAHNDVADDWSIEEKFAEFVVRPTQSERGAGRFPWFPR